MTYKSPMTAEDCYELGKVSYSDADYYHTELWMAQALKQLDEGEESTIDSVTILDYLSYSIYQQGELERALELTKRLLELGESSFWRPWSFHLNPEKRNTDCGVAQFR